MTAWYHFQSRIIDRKAIDVKEDTHETKFRLIIGVFMAVPAKSLVSRRTVDGTTVVKANVRP